MRMQVGKSPGPQRARIMQTREEINTNASLRGTPLAVPLATESAANPSKRGCRGICSLGKCEGLPLGDCPRWTARFFGTNWAWPLVPEAASL